jgi:hypothetical protein
MIASAAKAGATKVMLVVAPVAFTASRLWDEMPEADMTTGAAFFFEKLLRYLDEMVRRKRKPAALAVGVHPFLGTAAPTPLADCCVTSCKGTEAY